MCVTCMPYAHGSSTITSVPEQAMGWYPPPRIIPYLAVVAVVPDMEFLSKHHFLNLLKVTFSMLTHVIMHFPICPLNAHSTNICNHPPLLPPPQTIQILRGPVIMEGILSWYICCFCCRWMPRTLLSALPPLSLPSPTPYPSYTPATHW